MTQRSNGMVIIGSKIRGDASTIIVGISDIGGRDPGHLGIMTMSEGDRGASGAEV